MGSTTAKLLLPYPVGTDRVADGDNAMEALAKRIEARMPWGVVASSIWTTATASIGANPVQLAQITVPDGGAGRRLMLSGYVCAIHSLSAGLFSLVIRESAVDQQYCETVCAQVSANGVGARITHTVSASAGAHTYTLVAFTPAGTCTAHAASNRPAYFIAEDLGPASMSATLLPADERERVNQELPDEQPDEQPEPKQEPTEEETQ